MPAFIKFDGVDGEVDTATTSIADWVVQSQLAGADTFYGAMTNVELAITVTDTETGNGAPGTERASGLIYSGESGGLNSDPAGPSDVAAGSTAQAGGHAKWIEVESMTWGDAGSGHASPTGGTGHYTQLIWADNSVAHGTGGGGGAGKVSVHDVSLSTSVPKATAGEIGYGVEDVAAADADASAFGNTYLGVTTIEQGVLQIEHSTMMLSFQYYMA